MAILATCKDYLIILTRLGSTLNLFGRVQDRVGAIAFLAVLSGLKHHMVLLGFVLVIVSLQEYRVWLVFSNLLLHCQLSPLL
jgi:hypothetical protein